MDEPARVFAGRALTEQQVLPPIRRGLDGENPQACRVDHHPGLLQHLARARLPPRLPEHLIAAWQGEPPLALAVERAPDHEQAAPERDERHDDGRRILVARLVHAAVLLAAAGQKMLPGKRKAPGAGAWKVAPGQWGQEAGITA